MEKAVLISVQPKWCELIISGKKTVEVRKTHPKLETPFKCYIYCTYGEGLIEPSDPCTPNMLIEQKVTKEKTWGNCCNGKVIGEFACGEITFLGNVATDPWKYIQGSTHEYHKQLVTENACLTESEMLSYGGKYGWHISNLVTYDKPKELSEFMKPCKNDLYCEVCAMYSEFSERCLNKALTISRPPQSWCYVEELEDSTK